MNKYTKKDWIIAAFATLLVLVLGAFSLKSGLSLWGDDNAAYISEGIAIVDGNFKEQADLNFYMHPSNLPEEAFESSSIVYVWGYPLVLSLIYKVFGFSYDNIILYKLPGLLSLALTAGVVFMLFRRRFSELLSFVVSLMFCLSSYLFEFVNSIYSDLFFLFVSVLSFFLMDLFFEKTSSGKKNYLIGIFYGVTLWLTYETRLSGLSVLTAAFLSHAILFITQIKDKKKLFLASIYPYLLALVLVFVSERFIFAPATSNLSDISAKADIWENAKFYFSLFRSYFDSIVVFGYILYALFLVGLITSGFKKNNIIFTVFIIGTMVVNINLPYVQGLRYVFNILPFVFMYCAYGIKFIADLIRKLWKKVKPKDSKSELYDFISRFMPKFLYILAAFVVILSLVYPIDLIVENMKNRGYRSPDDVYSSEAVEVYEYIKTNTPEDSVIAFEKPRALYLNTGHKSFRNGFNEHDLFDADYYLSCRTDKVEFAEHEDVTARIEGCEVVFSNEVFSLYRLH